MYCLLGSFCGLLNSLRREHGSEDVGELDDYFEKLDQLKFECEEQKLQLSEAVEQVFLFNKKYGTVALNVRNLITENLSSVAFASNYFNPKYKATLIERESSLMDNIHEFLIEAVPENAISSMTDYATETNYCRKLFEMKKNEPIQFWEID